MPFCTNCGANVTGAFCTQCGTPLAAGASQGQPGPASMPGPAAPPYGQPMARKTSPIVWILVIVLGFFVLGGIAVVGTVGYFAHRAARLVSIDRNGGVAIHARGDDGKDASIEFGTSGKMPSWVPQYPGSNAKATFSVRGSSDQGEGGNFTFTTPDSADKVKSWYRDKFKDLGMKVNLETNGGDGAMLIAVDENSSDKRSLTVVVGGESGGTTVNVTYGMK